MKCPVDGSTLQLAERSGLEIDYCPDCRGIWLDRGELDKLIERGSMVSTAATNAAPPTTPPPAGGGGAANAAPGGPPASSAAPAGSPSVQSAAMDALRAVRELADAHKRKGGGGSFRGF